MRLLRIAAVDLSKFVGLYWTIRHEPIFREQGTYTRDFIKKWLHNELHATGVVWAHTEKDPKTGQTIQIKATDCTPKTNAVMYDETRITPFEQDAFNKLGYRLLSFQQAGFVSSVRQIPQNTKNTKVGGKHMTAMHENEKQDLLNQLNASGNPMTGKKVSILTFNKKASELDLTHVAKKLGAASVVLNDKKAQVFIGDYTAFEALRDSLTEEQQANFYNIDSFEENIFEK